MQYPGRIAATVAEQHRLAVAARFQQHRVGRHRKLLRQSDGFVALVEQYRLLNVEYLPMWVWDDIVQFMWRAEPSCIAAMGKRRDVDHVANVLMEFQATVMARAVQDQARIGGRPASIVELASFAQTDAREEDL